MKTDTLYLETYGCQMNEYDSDRIQNALGASITKNPKEADIVIVNTCAIRKRPTRRRLAAWDGSNT